ncbi:MULTISPECIES: aminotransferase class III-fold pyridoxal phosphate-dependent enzyme [unclassified Sphingomonas]|uniref:aminotransferase class III-fold pyridoxal phosphate-dependent enzyme n=1 Tax=unclassified Sphingomonas TaxID=196159 RepID=UPI00226A63A7|nr:MULTISPECIES: aminotransferase class III-fold pyridoxal phosphate-dependent enzyme [unclassified Sphingomonas]
MPGPAAEIADGTTLADLLGARAARPGRGGFRYLADRSGGDDRLLDLVTLDRRARHLALHLLAHADRGDRVLLCYPPGLDFIIGFFAAAIAGLIGVPVACPRTLPIRPEEFVGAAAAIGDCTPRLALTTAAVLAALPAGALDAGPRWIATDLIGEGATEPLPAPALDDLAYLQYTSGSTSAPKGVMISHGNVMANLAASQAMLPTVPEGGSTGLSWLPHYHDMGLVGGLLTGIYGDLPVVLMSPFAFLSRPIRWLRAISDHRATWSGGPNFAYELCCRQIRPQEIAGLDLSRWALAVNGAEPVRRSTIDRFSDTFAPAGFRREAMSPFYGLAEHVVFASGAAPAAPPTWVRGPGVNGGRKPGWYAGCGAPAAGHAIAIVDPDTRMRAAGSAAGEIWLSGPSVAQGYWGRADDSDEVFRATLASDGATTWLRTGDAGFIADGELVVTGRIKDMVIIAGTNHAPQDIEAIAEAAHPAIRTGHVVAFAVGDVTDRLVIAAEIFGERAGGRTDEVIAAIRAAVAGAQGITVGAVMLLRGRSLPKTSSGKIKRSAVRNAWIAQRSEGVVAEWPIRRPRPIVAAVAAMPDPGQLVACVVREIRLLLDDPDLVVDLEAPVHRLGLGSLELADLKGRIEEELGLDVPLARLLQGCSIADMVADLDGPPVRRGRSGGDRHPWERYVNPVVGGLLRRFRLDEPFVRGEGHWLVRADGSRILDGIAGYGALPFGHNPPAIWAALDRVRVAAEPSLIQPAMNDAAGELAQALLAVAPPGLRHVTFVNSGAEATEVALKLARAATGRRAFLSTANGFHGKTLGALSVTGRPAFQAPFGAPVLDVGYVAYGDIGSLRAALVDHPDRYAGLLVEPIQGEGGIVEPPAGYLAAAAELCRAHGVKLIVDEVQTGLGRTGALFACAAEDVRPDILLVAKALGGGLVPIGAVLCTADSYTEDFARHHSSTFAGNTLACRVGLASLALLTADHGRLVEEVALRGARLREQLALVVDRYPTVLRAVRGRGLLLGIQLTRDRAGFGHHSLLGVLAEQQALAPLVASYLLNVAQLRVAPTLLGSDVLRIEPPLTLEEAEIPLIVAAIEQAVRHLAEDDAAALVNHLLNKPRTVIPSPAPRAAPAIRRTATVGPRWGFLAHPMTAASYADLDASLACFSVGELGELAERIGSAVDPFVAGEIEIVGAGVSAPGQFVVVPWTAAALHGHRSAGLSAIRAGAALARANGAQVIGLGGYVSIASNGGLDLADGGVSLTTGNSYTAIAAVEAVEAACDRLDIALGEAETAIVGGGGSVGLGLTYLMAERAGRLVLIGNPAHPEASLRGLRRSLEAAVAAIIAERHHGGGALARRAIAFHDRTGSDPATVAAWLIAQGDCVLSVSMARALADSQLVLTATSSPDLLIDPEAFRAGAIVCDVSQPRNLAGSIAAERDDVLVLDGGLVAVPGRVDLGWRFGLPPGVAFACMCEPMILALEGRFDAAPRGLGVPLDYLRALRGWGLRHGFRLAELRSFGRVLGDGDWRRMRAAVAPIISPTRDRGQHAERP